MDLSKCVVEYVFALVKLVAHAIAFIGSVHVRLIKVCEYVISKRIKEKLLKKFRKTLFIAGI